MTQAELAEAVSASSAPKRPLINAFLAGQAAGFLRGAPHSYVWAYEELVHRVNLFRHLLGLYYAISTLASLAPALPR